MQTVCPGCGVVRPEGAPAGPCPSCLPSPAEPAALRRFSVNVRLQCLCGWQFYAPRTAPGFVNCPQCRAPVANTGARPAAPAVAPVEPEPPPKKRSRLPILVIAASAALLLVAGEVILVVVLGRRRPPATPVARIPEAAPTPVIPTSSAPSAPSPKPGPAVDPKADYIDYATRIDRMIAQSNMAGIAAAILIETGHVREHAELEDRMRVFDREIRELDRLRAERGERVALPLYFQAGDRLLALSDRVRDPSRPTTFVETLKEWLRTFRAGARETATVQRMNQRLSFETLFPERTKELNLLAQRTGIMLGEGNGAISKTPEAPPAAPAVPPPPAVSPYAPLLAEVQKKVAELHPYYRGRIQAEETERLRQAAVQGSPIDADAIRYRANADLLETFTAERERFASRAAELEARLPSLPGLGDIVHFKDGRKIEGTVEEQTEEKVRVRSRLGAATFPADQILRIEKGKGAAQGFPTRMQASRGKPLELESLLAWCGENNLPVHREAVACALLHLDPGHERARTDAGFARLPGGGWGRGDDARLKEGKIEWHGRAYTPDQLKQELRSLGYVAIGNVWYEKVHAAFRIDNLYRDQDLMAKHVRGSMQSQTQTDKDTVYDVRSKAWVPRTRSIAVARYLSSGTVDVPIPGPLLECRVKARGQTPRIGDTVMVTVASFDGDPFPKLLYRLTAPGENAQTIDVSEKMLGHSRVLIIGSTGAGGMFLPSDSNDIAILEVKYAWGRPLAKVNELLGVRPEPVPTPRPEAAVPAPITTEQAAASGMAETHSRAAGVRASSQASLYDALAEARRAMEGQLYYREVSIPPKYATLAEMIQNPLQPRLDAASREKVGAVTAWWAGLGALERSEFAAFYALWVAHARASGR